MEKFKVVIAGSRDFTDYKLLEQKVNKLLSNKNYSELEIVSGGCKGVDKLGEKFARDNGIAVKVFMADWNTYGRSAGPKRNEQMAKYSDALIAFWDGNSRGTKNMIDNAKKHRLIVRVVKIPKEA